MFTQNRRRTRAFTLVEMIITTSIVAIVMAIAAWMFQSVIYQHMFLESHLTAEEQARIALAKVTGAARQMSVDITDVSGDNTPAPPVIQPTATPGTVLEYTQVNSLQPGELPTPGGVPRPCYNFVEIQLDKPNGQLTGTLDEVISPVSSPCSQNPPPLPIVLAHNVEDFQVKQVPSNGATVNAYQIDITIWDQEDNANIDQRMGAAYHLSTVITPVVFGRAD